MIMLDRKSDNVWWPSAVPKAPSTPAVKSSTPKKEEEISVEDLPF
jgi:hypothetical protein